MFPKWSMVCGVWSQSMSLVPVSCSLPCALVKSPLLWVKITLCVNFPMLKFPMPIYIPCNLTWTPPQKKKKHRNTILGPIFLLPGDSQNNFIATGRCSPWPDSHHDQFLLSQRSSHWPSINPLGAVIGHQNWRQFFVKSQWFHRDLVGERHWWKSLILVKNWWNPNILVNITGLTTRVLVVYEPTYNWGDPTLQEK